MAPDKKFRVSAKALEIVDTLHAVLECAVMLRDADQRMSHLSWRDGKWLSGKTENENPARDGAGCVVEARITDRWTLFVSRRPSLHPDARSLARWAAENLAPLLPRSADDDAMSPPFDGGGGSGGSAEAGIPVWWARKVRS
ncbi:MAG TPA: hypothetical protein VIQ54_26565 [Polyangia bacterium]|jgi:hypothetical protein